jgi:hypothetical protein
MQSMHNFFKIGDRIGNFCNGFFGRDDYEDKTCVFVSEKYAIFEYDNGFATVLNHSDNLDEYVNGENWKPYENN